MDINQTTTIKLEESEINALKTIKDAYIQCVTNDCFSCDDCPLYIENNEICIGMCADKALYKLEKR